MTLLHCFFVKLLQRFLHFNRHWSWVALAILGVAVPVSPALGQYTPPTVTVKSGFQLMQNVPLLLSDMFSINNGNDPDLKWFGVCIYDQSADWDIKGVTSREGFLNGAFVPAYCMDIYGETVDGTKYGADWSKAALVATAAPGSFISFGPAFFTYQLACPNFPSPCARFPFGNFNYQIFSSGLTLSLQVYRGCELTSSAFSWKQFETSWGDKDYDHSYRSTTSYATKDQTQVSTTGEMELKAGDRGSFSITLSESENNLDGLAKAIKRHSGFNAVPRKETGVWWLDVYHTACQDQSCSPRDKFTLELCDDSCLAQSSTRNILSPKRIRQKGCYVTSLAMALNYVGVDRLTTTSQSKDLNPLVLNEFMSNTEDLSKLGGLFNEEGDVGPDSTTRRVGQNINNKSLEFNERRQSSVTSLADATKALDKALCEDKVPMIVGVKLNSSGTPGHFILVTGKKGDATDGSQYLIADPGSSTKKTLKDYNNQFVTRGVVKRRAAAATAAEATDDNNEFVARSVIEDLPDMSGLNISVGDNADLLVIDEVGRKTGFDVVTNTILEEIPESAYARSMLVNDETDEPATGEQHLVQIRMPRSGRYDIVVNGVHHGDYRVFIDAYSTDGTIQTPAYIEGVTVPGGASTWRLQYSAEPDAQPIVTPYNQLPVADAGPDQTVTAGAGCLATVSLDGTGSDDPDDDPLTFTWSGPFGTASGPTTTVSLPVGTHTITLTVDDGNSGPVEDTVTVVVEPANSGTEVCNGQDDNCDGFTDTSPDGIPISCDDGDACTISDACSLPGQCAGTVPLSCDDGNACTTDSCDSTSGCVYTPVAAGTSIGSCTTGLPGVCSAGVQTCTGDGTTICQQTTQPSPEVCGDGIDQDCDGQDLACPPPGTAQCGNGTVETGKQCDDGNIISGDGCSAECHTEGPVFLFSGFFPPVDNNGVVNQAKAGQAILVKWQVTNTTGVPIDNPAHFVSVTSAAVSCATLSGGTDVIEVYSGTSGLQYLGDGNWQFNWKTPKSYAGQCRIMRLNLVDQGAVTSTRTATFQFK